MTEKAKKILITGAKGFVGANTARHFKSLGFETYGVGHGDLLAHELSAQGLDHWISSDITIKAIKEFSVTFDVIVHCAGSGSVGFSVENPYQDFKKTVDGTLEVLEFIRVFSPHTHLIYPSSPAVQGQHPDVPIAEDYIGKPCSPYGYHKKIAEELCRSYSEKFDLKISVVRLFSVYGVGLKKQLLWDAVNKISEAEKSAVFWGTGCETRDFINIYDVVKIFEKLLNQNSNFLLINGGSGSKITIADVVGKIKSVLNSDVELSFNNRESIGNPIYYWASIVELEKIIDFEFSEFDVELSEYVRWARKQQN